MPLFDYKCHLTGETFEALVKDPEERPVCVCGIRTPHLVTKLPAAPAFHLKGTGWYKAGASR